MESKKLKVAMYSWFATGHMTPYLHLANKLAEHGHTVTFILPNKAITLLHPLNLYPSLITLHPITVPHVDPLPLGVETASEIPNSLHTHLSTAIDLTRPEFESIMGRVRPDIVLYDAAYWIPEVGSKFGFRSVNFSVVGASMLALGLVPARGLTPGQAVTVEDLRDPPRGYPSSSVVVDPRKLVFLGAPLGEGMTFYDRVTKCLGLSDAIAIRTCREVESKFCDYISSQYNKRVLLTGTILPELDRCTGLEARYEEWLGQFGPKSVVYCSFGSQMTINKAQFQELLLGFEMSHVPFLVALQTPKDCASFEEALPPGFRQRVQERGRVTGEWVQQPQILAHNSVGCFVGHGGAGSMWESLLSDNQIVLMPTLSDQTLNTKILVEELGVGIHVVRAEDGWVTKENLCKAIKCVMDENSEIGNSVKKHHLMWRNILGDPSCMNNYVLNFIKDLQALL
ncbi:hypothetical protein vseg_019978 [Gypsophila vaccaria]